MQHVEFARVRDLLFRVLSSPEDRDRILEEAGSVDRALRDEAEILLRYHVTPTSPGLRALSMEVPELPRFTIGDVLSNRYRIDTFIARGGMGEVFGATDVELEASIALKTIRPWMASDPASLARFKQEVLLARSISHPNVYRIFDLHRDEEKQVTFLTMEYLAGETLASRIEREGAIPVEEVLPLVRQLAEALDVAHRVGIVHRDVKSSNVMLVPSQEGIRAVITDFGLAVVLGRCEAGLSPNSYSKGPRLLGGCSEPSATSARGIAGSEKDLESGETGPAVGLAGTPDYMSPEQVTGEAVGPPSDLYSLGVVLFEMVTGELPFHGSTSFEIAHARLTQSVASSAAFDQVPPGWKRTIRRLLDKDPAARYPSGREVVLALEGRSDPEIVPRFFLRAEHDAFVGRTAELTELAKALQTSAGEPASNRLLTIIGPGGIGKTRLAMKYAWLSLGSWPGGAWFCDLSEARGREGILLAVSTALGVSLVSEDPVLQLAEAIAARGRCLLVLDNFEQVAEHAQETVGRWLERTTDSRFLVTSRERLYLPGESVIDLPPLDPRTQGVELFRVRGRAHRPEFEVHPSNRVQVEEIVERIDGFPLAIELAAARLRVLGVEQLRDRLQHSLPLLRGGAPGRHSALHKTLDWSWELLLPVDRDALLQLAVFEGGLSLEAAEAVLVLTHHEPVLPVIDVIHRLLDKSWLRSSVVMGNPRFDMYKVIRDFVREKSETRSRVGDFTAGRARSVDEARDRHLDHFAAVAREAWTIWESGADGQTEWLAFTSTETPNILAAIDHGCISRPELSSRLCQDVWWSWYVRGHFAIGISACEKTVAANREPNDARAGALYALGALLWHADKIDEAKQRQLESLALWETLRDRAETARSHNSLGMIEWRLGNFARAQRWFTEALAVRRSSGDKSGVALTSGNLGLLLVEMQHYAMARSYLEESLVIRRAARDDYGIAWVINALGNLALAQGDLVGATRSFEESLAIRRRLEDRRGIAWSLHGLSRVALWNSDLASAKRNCHESLTIRAQLGNPHWIRESIELTVTLARKFDEGAWIDRLTTDDTGAPADLADSCRSALAWLGSV